MSKLIRFVGRIRVTLSHRGNGAINDYQLLTRCVITIVFITSLATVLQGLPQVDTALLEYIGADTVVKDVCVGQR
jgi:hypothetical protein